MRNTIGGKAYKKTNHKRRSRNPNVPVDTTTGIDFYGLVQKRLGDNKILVKLNNGDNVHAVIPGKFRKNVWFNSGDYIHVRKGGDNSYDIIQKIVNNIEQANAQTAIIKQETGDNIFYPDFNIEENEEGEEDLSENNDFDAYGNIIESKQPKQPKQILLTKRKQIEKTRDINRRNNRDKADTYDDYDKPRLDNNSAKSVESELSVELSDESELSDN
jgi:initiation factor 1A